MRGRAYYTRVVSKLRLFVVRHGETAWSRERRFAGSRDVALEPEGLRQCEAVARALASQVVAAVYASPLERARASAEVIAKPHRLPVEIDPAFGEMAFGEWEGLTREEVAARFPAAYEEWRHAPHLVRIAGGETLAQVAERARGAVQALAATHTGETIVLVTHAIVTRLIVLDALGLGPERLWTVDATPAGITEIEYEPGWATVHRMNTLAHLEAAAP
ncbi:MAG: alpha-ribazole phosphatase [Candidatus Rokuibacteriota bacterium]|nr:MAG: alpha-ribazole phosphatase [Candidatus Rokubacteria bacterium]